jgi:hypothetical protein
MTALRWPVAALVAAVALVGAYVALGGRDYAPAAVPNPCQPRDWHKVADFTDLENEVALSALDGAACRLHVPQPALALAFTSESRLRAFARRHDLSTSEIAAATRAGLERAISEGRRAGAINELEGIVLSAAADRVPVDQLIGLVRGVLGG